MRIGLLSLMRISAFKEISFAAWVPRVGSSYSKALIFEWGTGVGLLTLRKPYADISLHSLKNSVQWYD